ncbi:MAG: TIGR02281 family clan AA aspartic protease [Rhodocyclaceae bacterium]|nr:MAG: TIGR02281 family clan AA aspartic protease [Rhodocyclaceae bacterium]
MGGAWHFRALLIWLAVLAVAYWGFDRYLAPKAVTTAAPASGQVDVPRSQDGHYYLKGAINGRPLIFMVDTGASSVAVSADFARAAGLPKGYPLRFSTANGSAEGELVSGQTVEAGGLTVSNIEVSVGIRMEQPDMALLGQSFLRHVEVVQSGDRLVLRQQRD